MNAQAIAPAIEQPSTAVAPSRALSPFSSSLSQYELALRQANALSAASLVPDAYKGAKGLPNILIAMELANRIGASPLMVMQNLYIVNGKPGWSSSFLIATVNACGRFEPLRFEIQGGDDPFAKTYRVRAYAKEKKSGDLCVGEWITWKMVEAEKWDTKPGSKWKTMPGQMFLYRGAAFWTRVYAPEVSLGMLTTEESIDVWGGDSRQPNAPTELETLKALTAELTAEGAEPPTTTDDTSAGDDSGEIASFAEVKGKLESAANIDALNEAADLIGQIKDAERRAELKDLYNQRLPEVP